MTDRKLLQGDELVKPGGEEKGAALLQFMRSAPDLSGLIPDDLYTPGKHEPVRSSYDGDFMQKVALAIDAEIDRAEKKGDEPVIRNALKKAGCPEDIYLQMSTHPDYKAVVQKVYTAFILMPRWASICRSMSKAAQAGDVAAARWVRDQIDSGDKTVEEAMAALEREGDDAVKRMAADLQLQLHKLITATSEAEAPRDVVAAALADVATQHGDPTPVRSADQASWFDEIDRQ
jgi:hypothetical protein